MQQKLKITDGELQPALEAFLCGHKTTAERVSAVERALNESGKLWREELGKWTVRVLPVELLVPEQYRNWRPLVRDAMQFVVWRLSAARLAPKVVEQTELPRDTPPELRLLRFIARVPGLQKIGQVLARNRNLNPKLRRALTRLENGISDVSINEVRTLIFRELEQQIKSYEVEVDEAVLSEASVSAVVGFTWQNPENHRRERGVFKVLKPYIPSCYSEDMKILQQLAGFLSRKHRASPIHLPALRDTLTEIRLLLQREVDFPREQFTLAKNLRSYRSLAGVRVPRLIQPLSAPAITALTRERGVKVTSGMARGARQRVRVAERLAEALVAAPILTGEHEAIFHADPHAGNVLYDKRADELVILDWALTERLTRDQRRRLFMLVLMTMLRDVDGICNAIDQLRIKGICERDQARAIRRRVCRFLDAVPLSQFPGAMKVMQLLDEMALEGVRFPAPLVMFRKAFFTLEGVLEDIAGCAVEIDSVMGRYALANCVRTGAALLSLFSAGDWAVLDWSVLTFPYRAGARAILRPLGWLAWQPWLLRGANA